MNGKRHCSGGLQVILLSLLLVGSWLSTGQVILSDQIFQLVGHQYVCNNSSTERQTNLVSQLINSVTILILVGTESMASYVLLLACFFQPLKQALYIVRWH